MVNQVKLAKTAKRLIEANGRELTLVNESTTSADPLKPHRGRVESADVTTTVIGIITNYRLSQIDGHLIRRGDKRCVIAANSLASGIVLTDYEKLIDTGVSYKIKDIEPVKPGKVPLIYFLQLRR